MQNTNAINQYIYQNLSLENMEGEIWKDCPSFEGYLMVSNKGRVKSMKRRIYQKTNGKTVSYQIPEIIRKQQLKPIYNKILKKNFYSLVIRITIEKRVYSFYTSRKVYEAFHGKIPAGYKVLHKDTDNLNNTFENLYTGTSTQVNRITALQGRTNVPEIFAQQRKLWPPERRKRLQQKSKTKKQVNQYDLQGNYIATYSSILEAQRNTGSLAIGKRLKGNPGISLSGGFLWKQCTSTDKLDITDIGALLTRYQKIQLKRIKKEG